MPTCLAPHIAGRQVQVKVAATWLIFGQPLNQESERHVGRADEKLKLWQRTSSSLPSCQARPKCCLLEIRRRPNVDAYLVDKTSRTAVPHCGRRAVPIASMFHDAEGHTCRRAKDVDVWSRFEEEGAHSQGAL